MNEKTPEVIEQEPESEKVRIGRELFESNETFAFPGLKPEVYNELKADEERLPAGFVTPLDELIARMNNEGIKVVPGSNPSSGNVFILPIGSDDIESDSIFPRHLDGANISSDILKELVAADIKK